MVKIWDKLYQKEQEAKKVFLMFHDKRVSFLKKFYAAVFFILLVLAALDYAEGTFSVLPFHAIRILFVVLAYLLLHKGFYLTSIYLTLAVNTAVNYYGAVAMETYNTFHLSVFIFCTVLFYLTKKIWVNVLYGIAVTLALIHVFYNQAYHQQPNFSVGIVLSVIIIMTLFFIILKFLVSEFVWLQEMLKNRNKELQESNAALFAKNEELRESNEFIRKLLSVVAHDLRNPFNHIIGFSNLLYRNLDKYDNKRKNEFLEQIVSSSEIGYQILENILSLARSQSHRIELKINKVNILDQLQSVVEEFGIHCQQKKQSFTVSCGNSIVVETDVTLFSVIIRNLCSNAVKFSPSGKQIEIEVKDTADSVNIYIINEGQQLAGDIKSKIEHHGMSNTSMGTAGEKGTGLGLAVCFDFAERLHAQLEIVPRSDTKNCFLFRLPKNSQGNEF